MSMTLKLRRAPDEVLGQLPTKGDATFEFLCPEDDSDPAYENGLIVDIDKAWHAIHYLLTKSSEETDLPAGFLVGGTPIGDDLGYGPARILKNKDVREVAAFLNRLPEDFVQTELKFSELQAADIYPTIWDREDDEDIKYVSGYFADLRKFISDAAAEDHGIILALL